MPEQQQQTEQTPITTTVGDLRQAARNVEQRRQTQQTETWATKTFTKPELKGHAILSRFQNADGLGESYIALEKKFSDKNARVRPGADATPEEKADFAKWLGVPEGADKYSLNAGEKIKEMLPEGIPVNDKFVKGAFDAFHKAGLTDEQASGVIAYYAQEMSADAAAMTEKLTKGLDDLKSECGHAYEGKLAVAGRAVDQFSEGEHAIKGLKELMDPETQDPIALWVQSNPAIIRLFMFLGEAMGEDELVEGEHRREEQAGDLKSKKAELMKADSPFWKGDHPDHKKFVDDVKAINDQLTGGNGAG